MADLVVVEADAVVGIRSARGRWRDLSGTFAIHPDLIARTLAANPRRVRILDRPPTEAEIDLAQRRQIDAAPSGAAQRPPAPREAPRPATTPSRAQDEPAAGGDDIAPLRDLERPALLLAAEAIGIPAKGNALTLAKAIRDEANRVGVTLDADAVDATAFVNAIVEAQTLAAREAAE